MWIGRHHWTPGRRTPELVVMRDRPPTDPAWRSLTSPADVADALVGLYERRGSRHYDETVTQTEHALQCAARAIVDGADDETVAAAFLHDIGHLLMPEEGDDDSGDGVDRHHEQVGGRFLANWFGDGVVASVRLHVAAKRYLCAVDRRYHDGLSPASVQSLIVQGGPMSEPEVADFGSAAHREAAVDLRRWDDLAKVPGALTPTLHELRERLVAVLARP